MCPNGFQKENRTCSSLCPPVPPVVRIFSRQPESAPYRVAPTACAVTFFAPGRSHQINPPPSTRPMATT